MPRRHGRAVAYTLNIECAIHALDQVKTYAEELLAASGGEATPGGDA